MPQKGTRGSAEHVHVKGPRDLETVLRLDLLIKTLNALEFVYTLQENQLTVYLEDTSSIEMEVKRITLQ